MGYVKNIMGRASSPSALGVTRLPSPAQDPGLDLRRHFWAMARGWPVWLLTALLAGIGTFMWASSAPKTVQAVGSMRVVVEPQGGSQAAEALAAQVAQVATSESVVQAVDAGDDSLRKNLTSATEAGVITVRLRGENGSDNVEILDRVMRETMSIYTRDGSPADLAEVPSQLDQIAAQMRAGEGAAASTRLSALADSLRSSGTQRVVVLDKAWIDPASEQPVPLQTAVFAALIAGAIAAEVVALLLTRPRAPVSRKRRGESHIAGEGR